MESVCTSGIGLKMFGCFADGAVDGEAEVVLTTFIGRHAAHDMGPVLECFLGVLGGLRATLYSDPAKYKAQGMNHSLLTALPVKPW